MAATMNMFSALDSDDEDDRDRLSDSFGDDSVLSKPGAMARFGSGIIDPKGCGVVLPPADEPGEGKTQDSNKDLLVC